MRWAFLLFYFQIQLVIGSTFLPERGHYIYTLEDIKVFWEQSDVNYLVPLRSDASQGFLYKHDSKKNEFILKNWFTRDWYKLQEMFALDEEKYLEKYEAKSLLQAKVNQFKKYAFNFRKNYHYKQDPSLKEWGGLTYPPLRSLSKDLSFYYEKMSKFIMGDENEKYFDVDFQLELDQISNSTLTFNNKLTLLEDSDSFESKMDLITNADKRIYMSSLVFVCDQSTKSLVGELIKKKNQGLDVRIIVDGFISKLLGHKECLDLLEESNIEVLRVNVFFKYFKKTIYHSKVLVVDDEIAITGGQNMIDADNLSRGTDFKNRDVDVLIHGPLVTDVALSFVKNWQHFKSSSRKFQDLTDMSKFLIELESRKKLEHDLGKRGSQHYPQILSNQELRFKGVCRYVMQTHEDNFHQIGKVYLALLNHLKKHLILTNPIAGDTYVLSKRKVPLLNKFDRFEMFNQLFEKIQSLAEDGIQVDYITTTMNMAGNENVAILNEKIKDKLLQRKKLRANWSYLLLLFSNYAYGKDHYRHLINDWSPIENVSIWNHISFMHSKVFYFDRTLASIGSYNFEHNATDHSYESTVICSDFKLNRELERALVLDMVNSIPLLFAADNFR